MSFDFARAAISEAREYERMHWYGRMLGLSETEAHEVSDAWQDYYQSTPWPFDHQRVKMAMVDRMEGRDWRP